MARTQTSRTRLPVLVAVAAAVASGCGSGERSFTAREFAAEADRGGAGIAVGDELFTNQPGTRVYAAEVSSSGSEPVGGSIVVKPDAAQARAYFTECAALCYRAANVVLLVEEEETDPETQGRLAQAIRQMASD